jgi:uncharacterized protein (TIGR02284 family)
MANVVDRDEIARHLNNLIELDYDAIAAYDAAIERLEDVGYKNKLQEFRDDHKRHVEELGKLVQAQGKDPSASGDVMKILTKGQVVIGGLAGDGAILEAMKLNEDQTNSKYERAVDEDFPQAIHQALEQGLADERRHRAWIEETLERMS